MGKKYRSQSRYVVPTVAIFPPFSLGRFLACLNAPVRLSSLFLDSTTYTLSAGTRKHSERPRGSFDNQIASTLSLRTTEPGKEENFPQHTKRHLLFAMERTKIYSTQHVGFIYRRPYCCIFFCASL